MILTLRVFHRNIWYKVLDLDLLKSKDTPVMIPLIGQQRNISSPCHETSYTQVTTRNRLKRAISRYNLGEFKSILGFRQVTIHPTSYNSIYFDMHYNLRKVVLPKYTKQIENDTYLMVL